MYKMHGFTETKEREDKKNNEVEICIKAFLYGNDLGLSGSWPLCPLSLVDDAGFCLLGSTWSF